MGAPEPALSLSKGPSHLGTWDNLTLQFQAHAVRDIDSPLL